MRLDARSNPTKKKSPFQFDTTFSDNLPYPKKDASIARTDDPLIVGSALEVLADGQ